MIKNKKKTTKAKRKVVRCKKKKTAKKKTTKKKTTKKKVRKKKLKKSKRKRRKKVSMEDIYSIINKVQLGKKRVTFATSITESPTIENNIKDAELKYNKREMKTQVVFTIYPNDEKYEEDLFHFDITDDEIPEIGQIFG